MDLAAAFALTVARRPGACAIVDEGVRRTYSQWQAEAARVAGGLALMGLRQGDHLLVLLKNRYETTLLYWASHMLGLVFTPLNWRARAGEVAYCVEDAEIKAIVFEDASGDAARTVDLPKIVVGKTQIGETSFQALLQSSALAMQPNLGENQVCLMLYTSGTTGKPKGVPRTHRNEISAAVSQIAHNRYLFGECSLGVMPLYHTMGIRVLLSSALLNGTFVCMSAYDSEHALRLIRDERVTTMFLVPTLYYDLLTHPRLGSYDLGSLGRIGYAGMTMTDALSQSCLDRLRPELFVNYYGSSEVYTIAFCDHVDAKPGCAGRPGINQAIRVVRPDPEGSATAEDVVPQGQTGEVIASLTSPEAFAGYWKRPDADAKALRDRWYFTGDLGRLDEDGELYLVGRVDDMVITGGENVYPEEVENVLARCPLVGRAAVIGMPDERWGQRLVAFVEPAQVGASSERLDRFCREAGLVSIKCPKEYIFVERIPQSPVGKLLRRELRAGNFKRKETHDR
jgi:2-furoate---CoA ligase